jgi:hypothetical protein
MKTSNGVLGLRRQAELDQLFRKLDEKRKQTQQQNGEADDRSNGADEPQSRETRN